MRRHFHNELHIKKKNDAHKASHVPNGEVYDTESAHIAKLAAELRSLAGTARPCRRSIESRGRLLL